LAKVKDLYDLPSVKIMQPLETGWNCWRKKQTGPFPEQIQVLNQFCLISVVESR